MKVKRLLSIATKRGPTPSTRARKVLAPSSKFRKETKRIGGPKGARGSKGFMFTRNGSVRAMHEALVPKKSLADTERRLGL